MSHSAWVLPRWLVYWATIRVWAHATTGQYGTTEAPALTVAEALNRWDTQHRDQYMVERPRAV